jgi:hypothetical protein
MGKKQRRMERYPSLDDRGKRKPMDVSGKINMDFDIDPTLKKLNDDAADAMRRMAGQMGAGFLFGGPPGSGMGPKERGGGGGGRISGDGMAGFVRAFGVNSDGLFPRLEERSQETVSTMIFEKAVKVWENPINWTFGVGYNAGQATYWFTARYHDEEGTMLVEETQEFTEDQLLGEQWESVEQGVEVALKRMHERCEAEIAMFEEDS